MAIGFNRVDLIGNLGKDPQVSNGDKGMLRASFTLAVDRPRSEASGERGKETDWFPVIAFGRVADRRRSGHGAIGRQAGRGDAIPHRRCRLVLAENGWRGRSA
jgi:hypothetical protein